jgi:hypothetical protein
MLSSLVLSAEQIAALRYLADKDILVPCDIFIKLYAKFIPAGLLVLGEVEYISKSSAIDIVYKALTKTSITQKEAKNIALFLESNCKEKFKHYKDKPDVDLANGLEIGNRRLLVEALEEDS